MFLRTMNRAAMVLVAGVVGCASTPHADKTDETIKLAAGDSSADEAPSGVDIGSRSCPAGSARPSSGCSARRTRLARDWQAVPLDVCIEEKRPGHACGPAARFLADRVKAGLATSDIQRAYGMRFGSDVRPVDIADSPMKGDGNAPVTLMVWSDFECPACKRIVPMIERVFSAHAKDVRLVHKLYPLPKHPHSEIAARASYAAKLQGKYWEMEHARSSRARTNSASRPSTRSPRRSGSTCASSARTPSRPARRRSSIATWPTRIARGSRARRSS